MMLAQIKLMARLELCNLFGINVLRFTKDKRKKKRAVMLSVLWVLLIIMLLFYVGGLSWGLVEIGAGKDVPAYVIAISSMLIFVFGILKAGSIIFRKQGYDMVVALPVRKGAVVLGRFLRMYTENLLMAALVLLPGIAVYAWQMMAFLKKKADYIIETDSMLTKELRNELEKIFVDNKEFKNLFINIVSFGFKYGIPADSDLLFDVRFMPNPFYVEGLKRKTGNDKEVNDFVMNSKQSVEFLKKLDDMINFLIPNYVLEGKNQLVISIGCTGGKHRSVTIANRLYEELKQKGEYGVKLTHRDIERE